MYDVTLPRVAAKTGFRGIIAGSTESREQRNKETTRRESREYRWIAETVVCGIPG